MSPLPSPGLLKKKPVEEEKPAGDAAEEKQDWVEKKTAPYDRVAGKQCNELLWCKEGRVCHTPAADSVFKLLEVRTVLYGSGRFSFTLR